jgi:hypothetical protein
MISLTNREMKQTIKRNFANLPPSTDAPFPNQLDYVLKESPSFYESIILRSDFHDRCFIRGRLRLRLRVDQSAPGPCVFRES